MTADISTFSIVGLLLFSFVKVTGASANVGMGCKQAIAVTVTASFLMCSRFNAPIKPKDDAGSFSNNPGTVSIQQDTDQQVDLWRISATCYVRYTYSYSCVSTYYVSCGWWGYSRCSRYYYYTCYSQAYVNVVCNVCYIHSNPMESLFGMSGLTVIKKACSDPGCGPVCSADGCLNAPASYTIGVSCYRTGYETNGLTSSSFKVSVYENSPTAFHYSGLTTLAQITNETTTNINATTRFYNTKLAQTTNERIKNINTMTSPLNTMTEQTTVETTTDLNETAMLLNTTLAKKNNESTANTTPTSVTNWFLTIRTSTKQSTTATFLYTTSVETTTPVAVSRSPFYTTIIESSGSSQATSIEQTERKEDLSSSVALGTASTVSTNTDGSSTTTTSTPAGKVSTDLVVYLPTDTPPKEESMSFDASSSTSQSHSNQKATEEDAFDGGVIAGIVVSVLVFGTGGIGLAVLLYKKNIIGQDPNAVQDLRPRGYCTTQV